jgi:hypothetical protein
MVVKDTDRIGRTELLALLEQTTKERDTARAVLHDILRVTREAPDNPLEDAFGHALAYIQDAAEEALGKTDEDY